MPTRASIAELLREKHDTAVRSNSVKIDPQWHADCRAFNIQVALPGDAKRALGEFQDAIQDVEPDLLRCPVDTLHISLMPLLAVRVEYSRPKEELWDESAPRWLRALEDAVSTETSISLHFRQVVATDAAVVVVAAPVEPVNELRRRIASRLELPPAPPPLPTLVHTSIFRYGSPLRDPETFLATVNALRPSVPLTIVELTVSREVVYPSIVVEEIQTFKLP
jgi:hypothetical protein